MACIGTGSLPKKPWKSAVSSGTFSGNPKRHSRPFPARVSHERGYASRLGEFQGSPACEKVRLGFRGSRLVTIRRRCPNSHRGTAGTHRAPLAVPDSLIPGKALKLVSDSPRAANESRSGRTCRWPSLRPASEVGLLSEAGYRVPMSALPLVWSAFPVNGPSGGSSSSSQVEHPAGIWKR